VLSAVTGREQHKSGVRHETGGGRNGTHSIDCVPNDFLQALHETHHSVWMLLSIEHLQRGCTARPPSTRFYKRKV